MSIDLTNEPVIQSNLFVRIQIDQVGGGVETVTFTDYHRAIEIGGETYTGLGSLLTITATNSDLRVTAQELTLEISGIPSENIADFVSQECRGSEIRILRGIMDPDTGQLMSIANNPAGRFSGIINSFGVTEQYSASGRDSTHAVQLICASRVSQLLNLVSGRATNPWQQDLLYPGDRSFDRVPNIANANFNFGAP